MNDDERPYAELGQRARPHAYPGEYWRCFYLFATSIHAENELLHWFDDNLGLPDDRSASSRWALTLVPRNLREKSLFAHAYVRYEKDILLTKLRWV